MVDRDTSGDAGTVRLAVGCYTPDGGPGIVTLDWAAADGSLRRVGAHDGVVDASYLAAHPVGGVLYAVSERTEPDSGEVVALRVDADGTFVELDRVASHGAAPCHVASGSSPQRSPSTLGSIPAQGNR